LSTLPSTRSITCEYVDPGYSARTRAAVPAACGVAIEVPLLEAYALPGVVLRTETPGAARSTVLVPKFEVDAKVSVESTEATERMLSRL
jgi:hypothetical protein